MDQDPDWIRIRIVIQSKMLKLDPYQDEFGSETLTQKIFHSWIHAGRKSLSNREEENCKECFRKDFKINSKNTVLNKIATSKAKQLSYLRFYKDCTVISSGAADGLPPLTLRKLI